MDSRAAVQATVFRATEVDQVYLLSPSPWDDLTNRQDAGVVALIGYLKRLQKPALETFLSDASTYRPVTADEPALSPTYRDDLAHQRDAADVTVQVDSKTRMI